jgi:suppressor of tumorigenicity protein 13
VTEDEEEEAMGLMGSGRSAMRKGDLSSALALLTEAIEKNPSGSILFATRAEILVEMKRPIAAIRDATKSIELNPDSGKALKARGKAYRFTGKYEEAFKDLANGNKVDWDDGTDALVKELQPHVDGLFAYRRRLEERARLESETKPAPSDESDEDTDDEDGEVGGNDADYENYDDDDDNGDDDDDAFGGGYGARMGGFGGMGGGGGISGRGAPMGGRGSHEMAEAMADPEVQRMLQDPEVMMKLQAAMSNPALLQDMMMDPKLGPVLRKLMGGAQH